MDVSCPKCGCRLRGGWHVWFVAGAGLRAWRVGGMYMLLILRSYCIPVVRTGKYRWEKLETGTVAKMLRKLLL
ncbi:hypothetical protein HanHA300_Chr11g0393641 [Helianthus annuus]|nr:hypothetical protein HanHA300_Chr11g0393641 [Helianthus annuus]KAJ0516688.1 hypothetical protein HanHA89_Chr11g0416621 [Helianthus annuus]KAJ0684690.1 hypothetical protein HanLR1_Chr11g0394001 [Helianthus annuus]